MKTAIVGSRDFSNYYLLEMTLKRYYITEIISGGARGADTLAEKYAEVNNISTKIFKPDWVKHGRSAGFIRNNLIVEAADFVIAFWDGKSRGTLLTINLAKKKKKSLKIIKFGEKHDTVPRIF